MNIAIYVYEGAEELDWVGPWEVLAAWARRWPETGATVFTITDTSGAVTCANGMRMLGDHTWDGAPEVDVLVIPGGNADVVSDDLAVRARVQAIAARGGLLTSVCTGAFVLWAAGALEGKPATTHWASMDKLRALGVDVRDERFVDAGDVVTSAGVSAGIDMALHLIARLDSAERSAEIRRYIQYDAPSVQ